MSAERTALGRRRCSRAMRDDCMKRRRWRLLFRPWPWPRWRRRPSAACCARLKAGPEKLDQRSCTREAGPEKPAAHARSVRSTPVANVEFIVGSGGESEAPQASGADVCQTVLARMATLKRPATILAMQSVLALNQRMHPCWNTVCCVLGLCEPAD